MSDLIYKEAQEAQRKLFYGLISVALGALALSIQFSPKMGHNLEYLLVTSWALLFLSSAVGGWRLGKESAMLKNIYYKLISNNDDEKATLDKLNDETSCKVKILTKIQIWSLLLGILANLFFSVANYIVLK